MRIPAGAFHSACVLLFVPHRTAFKVRLAGGNPEPYGKIGKPAPAPRSGTGKVALPIQSDEELDDLAESDFPVHHSRRSGHTVAQPQWDGSDESGDDSGGPPPASAASQRKDFVPPARLSPTRKDLHVSRRFIQQLEAQRLAAQQAVGVAHHEFDKERRQLANLEGQYRTLLAEENKLQQAHAEFTRQAAARAGPFASPAPKLSSPTAMAQQSIHAPAPTYLSLQKVQQQLALVAQLTEKQHSAVVLQA